MKENRLSAAVENPWKLLWLLMAGGLLLRVIYLLAAPYDISPHDLGSILENADTAHGHLGYIGYLLNHHRLPDFDPRTAWAFYNPPFFYCISALWLQAADCFGASFAASLESLQFLTTIFSTASVYLSVRILEEFGVKGRTLVLLTAFLSFFPTFTWMAVTLTPDGLALTLMLLAILSSVRWYKAPSLKRIVLPAFAIGLGMLTKLNAAYAAFGAAFLFIARFVQAARHERAALRGYLGQFAVFAMICLPLGLFWSVRNGVLFGMPFNYIPGAGEDQYIGDAGVWARLGLPRLEQLLYARVQFDCTKDTNIWLTLIRTALFDEADLMRFTGAPIRLLGGAYFLYSLLLALGMNACYVLCLFRKKCGMGAWAKVYTLLLYVPLFLSYLAFCFSYPHICTMNYRYIAVLTVVPVLAAGLVFHDGLRRSHAGLYKLFEAAVVLHAALSAFVYLQYSVVLFAGA